MALVYDVRVGSGHGSYKFAATPVTRCVDQASSCVMDLSAITAGFSVRDSYLIRQNLSFLSALRFFLGLAEAGLYPGIVFYISWQVVLSHTDRWDHRLTM